MSEGDKYSFRKLYEQIHRLFEGKNINNKKERVLYLVKENQITTSSARQKRELGSSIKKHLTERSKNK